MEKLTLLKGRRSKADIRNCYVCETNNPSKNKEVFKQISLDKKPEESKVVAGKGFDDILFLEKQIKID